MSSLRHPLFHRTIKALLIDVQEAGYEPPTLENRDAFNRIFETISQEYSLTRKLILDITGNKRLLCADPALQLSVDQDQGCVVQSFLQFFLAELKWSWELSLGRILQLLLHQGLPILL